MTTIRSIIIFFGISFITLNCSAEEQFDVINWFTINHETLEEIVSILNQHPNIERVDPGLSLTFVTNNEEFSDADVSVYKDFVKRCESLKIENIVVFRKEIDQKIKTISTEFVVVSEGLLTKGRTISVEYLEDLSLLENASSYGLEYQPLNKEGWYAVYREQK